MKLIGKILGYRVHQQKSGCALCVIIGGIAIGVLMAIICFTASAFVTNPNSVFTLQSFGITGIGLIVTSLPWIYVAL